MRAAGLARWGVLPSRRRRMQRAEVWRDAVVRSRPALRGRSLATGRPDWLGADLTSPRKNGEMTAFSGSHARGYNDLYILTKSGKKTYETFNREPGELASR